MLLTKRWLAGDVPSAGEPAGETKSAAFGGKKRPKAATVVLEEGGDSGEESASHRRKRDLVVSAKAKKNKQTKSKVAVEGDAGDRGEGDDDGAGDDDGDSGDAGANAKAKAKARRRKKKKHKDPKAMKDPEVAAAYLEAWSSKQSGKASEWRFNKATQAWLLRHAYEPEKVEKGTFNILLKYLEGLKGGARERMQEEATAVVTLKGAPLTSADAEADQLTAKAQKRVERRKKSAEGMKNATAKAEGGEDGEDVKDAVDEEADQDTEVDTKARKLRLRRAKQVLVVLGDGDDGVGDEYAC